MNEFDLLDSIAQFRQAAITLTAATRKLEDAEANAVRAVRDYRAALTRLIKGVAGDVLPEATSEEMHLD